MKRGKTNELNPNERTIWTTYSASDQEKENCIDRLVVSDDVTDTLYFFLLDC